MTAGPLTNRTILIFWLPLAGTWLMMSIEGPYLAAIIARLPDPTVNLSAFGVTFAFANIIEVPVIMLLAASTALVEDRQSYLALRQFSYGLSPTVGSVRHAAGASGTRAPDSADYLVDALRGHGCRRHADAASMDWIWSVRPRRLGRSSPDGWWATSG